MLGSTGKPLTRRYYSDKSGRDLDPDSIVRGYEFKKNRFVDITDEELERLAPKRSRDIALRRFVDESSIPRIYFERAYFLAPAGSNRAYHLLAKTMERTGRTGIATFVMRGKEYLVAINADNGILRAGTMRFCDEIRSPEDIGLPKRQKPAPASVRSFERVIAQRERAQVCPRRSSETKKRKAFERLSNASAKAKGTSSRLRAVVSAKAKSSTCLRCCAGASGRLARHPAAARSGDRLMVIAGTL